MGSCAGELKDDVVPIAAGESAEEDPPGCIIDPGNKRCRATECPEAEQVKGGSPAVKVAAIIAALDRAGVGSAIA